ncbi:MAG TPA: hypothetical protein VM532_07140 [Burkholderiales bacterium]|nr:hypothetical protein [Burkholderiales bacterium]
MKLHRHFFALTLFAAVTGAVAQGAPQESPQERQRLIDAQDQIREYKNKEQQARKRGDTKEAEMWADKRYQAQEASGIEKGRINRGETAEGKQDIKEAQQRLAEDQKQIEEYRAKEAEARKRGDTEGAHEWADRRHKAQQEADIEKGRINREEQELKKGEAKR